MLGCWRVDQEEGPSFQQLITINNIPSLPAYLSDDIERVQRRALSIISPELSYHDSLDRHGLASLYDRRMKLCTDLFLSVSNPSHKLYNLLPDRNFSAYNTRHRRVFNMPRFCTARANLDV